jgi:hypothetical protein
MDYGNERQSHYKNERSERSKRIRKKIKENFETYGCASFLILTNLLVQAHIKLKTFSRNRGRSENKY